MLRILVIDDQPQDAEDLILRLRRGSTELMWKRVERLDDLVDGLQPGAWDVVLCSYTLRGLNSRATLSAIHKFDPNLPFIVISDIPGEETAVEIMRLGASDYLLKSSLERLNDAVDLAVQNAKNRQADRISAITAEKRAEEISRTTERRFQALVEKSYDAIVLCDANGVIIYASPACARIGGAPVEQYIGKSTADVVHPDELPAMAIRWAKLLAKPGSVAFGVTRFLRADGTFGYAESTDTNLLHDPDVRAVVTNFRDVTERIEAETERKKVLDELYRTSQLLRAVAENSSDAIFVKDLAGKYLLFNEASARFVGRAAESVIGQDDTGLFDAAGVQQIIESDRRVMESGNVLITEQELTAAGATRIFQTTKAPYRDEQGVLHGLIGIARDVTEQKLAEKALQASEEQYRTLINQIPDPLFVYDRETLCYLAVNDAAIKNYGYTRAEFLGMTLNDIRPAEDIPALEAMFARSSSGHQSRGVWRHCKKDGTVIDVEINAHDLTLGGRPACVISARDVTDRKRAEEELRDSQQRLEHLSRKLIATRETELQHLSRELHDHIGQVLTAMKINLRRIQQSADESFQKRLQENVSMIDEAITQVRNLSLYLRPPHLSELGLVATLHWYLRQQAENAGIRTHLDVTPAELQIPEPLAIVCFRIIQEAVTNAVRHAGNCDLNVEMRFDNSQLSIAIRDNGVGFDVDLALERAQGGSSLGLINMKERASLAGGNLIIESRAGNGTAVFAQFPIPRSS